MKKYIKSSLIILGISSLAITSCKEDILTTIPNDRVSTEVYWRSDLDAKYAVNAIYSALDGTNIFVLDGVTDIGHTNTVFTVEYNIENGTYDASHSRIQSEWQNLYRGIFLANYLLENIDQVKTATNGVLLDQYKSEARSLRACFYMKLAALYGDIPLITKNLSPADGLKISRTKVSDVWSFIDKELTESSNLLPLTYSSAERGRITKGSALALKARAALWSGNFATAATAAKSVMDLNIYGLIPEYGKLFTYANENSKEVILDKQFLAGSVTHNAFAYMGPYSQKTSSSVFVPTKALADAFPMKNGKDISDPTSGFDPKSPYSNRDPRMKFTMYVDGDLLPSGVLFKPIPGGGGADEIGKTQQNTTTGFSLKKYVSIEDFGTPGACALNIILLRYAEVLLTYAEAKIELNQIDQSVFDAINLVRTRSDVGLPPLNSNLSQSALREAVRKERNIELAFEGLRLFDIRRWKIAEKVMVGKVYGITYPTGTSYTTVELPSVIRAFDANKHYLWPIPQKEKLLNTNLSQNTGW